MCDESRRLQASTEGNATEVDVLMYHSISDGPAPTSLRRDTFCAQLDAIAAHGYCTITMSDLADWLRGTRALAARTIALTFDDGFVDFLETAFPELCVRGMTATVFVPVAKLGGREDWPGSLCHAPRRLLDWEQVAWLASQGIEFGSHGMTHADLTRLAPEALHCEIERSQCELRGRLGRAAARSFAAPYGRTNAAVQQAVSKFYDIAVGTRLARTRRPCDRLAVPRLEMYYFRDARRWSAYLEGRAQHYLLVRRCLRHARQLAGACLELLWH